MNPTTMDATNTFSQCTVGNICSGFAAKTVSTTCLTSNKNVTLITAGECGNGIVEDGEECDCGGVSGCGGDKCCDPRTCKFTTGSVCDDANDVCCQSCQYAPTTKVCRPSIDATCDPQETCTGNSSTCPPDITASDGKSCGSGLKCASGSCTSRNMQCQQALNASSTACDSSTCMLTCTAADLGPDTCVIMQGNFIDGTPCGYGGQCLSGACQGTGTGAAIGSWISQNKTLVIVIGSVLGTTLLLCIGACCWRSFSNKRKRPYVASHVPRNAPRAPPPPPRDPSMVYYPQTAPAYNASLPAYIAPAAPNTPARYGRSWTGNDERTQQPGEEWVKGPDGSYYPPGSSTPQRPPRTARRPVSNRNYWET
jgi:Disintegrin